MESSSYAALGASSSKAEVRAALRGQEKGLYPGAFCGLWPDVFSGDPNYVYLLHADGVGTKAALAYIYWKETGDPSVWRGIAQDALVMNTDDALCVGANRGPFLFSSTLARNTRHVPSEVIAALIEGTSQYIEQLRDWGFEAHLCGGETADLGDIVRTLVVDATLSLRMRREEVIDNARIQLGDLVVGLASSGTTSYDSTYNSGIGSNGLTLARHVLLSSTYASRYPESYDSALLREQVYRGPYGLLDELPGTSLGIGQALLSPTRSYLPFMRELIDTYRPQVHGLVHCTGGGQTKLLSHLERDEGALHIIKDKLLPVPPLFDCIRQAASLSWQEMYQVFNMGHRLEVYTDCQTAEEILRAAQGVGLSAQLIGRVEAAASDAPRGQMSILCPEGMLEYRA